MSGRATLVQSKTAAEGSTFVNSFLSEITRSRGVGPTVARAALAGQTTDGVVDLDAEEMPPPADESTIAVVGSGNLGLVYFTGHDHRLSFKELEELHPNLVASLASHPGVAMLMVRTVERGSVVFGHDGLRYLDDDVVEGEDPTTLFGPHTVMSLKRVDAMDARAGPAAHQRVQPGARRGGRVRGAHRVARRARRAADAAVHPPSVRVDARRGGPARRAGHLPQHPPLAGVDRHPAGQGAASTGSTQAAPAASEPEPAAGRPA